MNNFSENLRMLREERELKQAHAAEIFHTNKATYNRYEMGKTEPDIDTLIQMADFFNVSIDSLVGRKFPGTGDGIQKVQNIQQKREIKQDITRMVQEIATEFIESKEKDITEHIAEKFNL